MIKYDKYQNIVIYDLINYDPFNLKINLLRNVQSNCYCRFFIAFDLRVCFP